MEIKIVTLAYNRPDFIELQFNSLKKWVKDFEYIVYDNSLNNEVENECKRLGIKSIKLSCHGNLPNYNASAAITQIWKQIQNEKRIVVFIDSDMFMIGELPDITDYDAGICYNYANERPYPWACFFMFNLTRFPHPEEINWDVGKDINGCTGAYIHKHLEKYNPKVLELDSFTLYEPGVTFNRRDWVCTHEIFGKMEELCVKNGFPHPYAIDMMTVFGEPYEKSFIFHYKSAGHPFDYMTPQYVELKTMALRKLLS